MKKTLQLLTASLLLSSLNTVMAATNITTEQLPGDSSDIPVIPIAVNQSKSANENLPAFAMDIKGYVQSDGTTMPYNAYRHSLVDPENRSWVANTTDEQARPYSMAWSANASTLYSLTRTDDKKLMRIDPQTLEATAIANLNGLLPNQLVQGMAIDENNTCYVITTDDANHDTVSSLYTCNLATGSLTLVGTQSEAPDLHDIVATCDDTLYGIDSYAQSLYKVSKFDGSVELVGVLGVSDDYGLFNMAYDRINGDLYLYVLAETGVHTAFAAIDKNNGNLEFLTDSFKLGVEVGAIESSCDERVVGFQLHPGFNGAWVNPATNGQGLLVDIYPTTDLLFAAWFTFDDGAVASKSGGVGSSEQRWMTASGALGDNNVVELTLYNTSGGVFDDPAAIDTVAVGSMTIDFIDCSSGLVTYDLDDSSLTGSFPIQRVAGDNIAMCESMSGSAVQ